MSIHAFAELNKLKNIQFNLSKAQAHFIEECCKEDGGINDFIQKINSESSTECEARLKEVMDIYNKMQDVRQKISLEESPESLKIDLIDLKNSIENVNISCKYRLKELQKDEHDITEDLQYYEKMYETWSKPIEIIEEPTYTKRTTLNKIECPEVKAFDQFIHTNLGHTHGWTVEDSAMFLKLKHKYKTSDKVAEKLHNIFPDKTIEEIKNHYQWHEDYCKLRNKQKEAIKQWKLRKQNNVNISSSATTSSSSSAKSKKHVVHPMNSEETKAKIMAWKEEKRHCEEQQMIVEQLSEQFNKQLAVMRFQKKMETKEKIVRWRAIKAAEKRAIEVKRREEELKTHAFKSMLANKFIREFQEQDARFIQRMQNSKHAKISSNPCPKLEAKIIVSRDPDRLLKPTKTWILKVARDEQPMQTIGRCNLNLNSIQKLKAPDWRK